MDGTGRIDELEKKFIENPRRFFAPLANEYRKAGNPHQAIAICRAHLGQLPGHMSGQIVYGQALYEAGEYDEARTVFENALAMDRENLIALKHLGDLALRDGEAAAARQFYSKLLEIDPQDAMVTAIVNEIDAAVEVQTTPAEPADDEPAGDRAAAPEAASTPPPESAHHEEEDSLISEELGFPVPPPHAFVTETMAELYLAQGFRDRAVDVYKQLAALHPDDERLHSRLTELEPAPTVAESAPTPVEPAPTLDELRVTVRDFFAILGSRRPPSRSNGESAAVGGTSGGIFPGGASNEADRRAASALAGAFASPGKSQTSPTGSVPGRESEEDVARFRAWLDGLSSQ